MPLPVSNLDPLKAHSLKNTKQRKAILNVLSHSATPLSAEDIYVRLKAENAAGSLSTVYRTLEQLCEHDVLQRVTLSGDNRMAYVLEETEHHHYIVCSQCKQILPISHCPLQAFEKALAEETGYVLQGHRLDLYGLCPQCQQKEPETAVQTAVAPPESD